MMQVWFLFKSLEALVGSICVAYHCMGFQGKEPLPHILIYCGTFFGFTIMSFTGAVALGVGAAPPALTEFFVNFVAAFLYIVASIVSMHHAEHDFHLMYLSDFEEPKHPYFAYCRAQSICALAAGALHLLHAVLAFDVMFTPRTFDESSDESESESGSDITTLERRPIRMYFLSKVIETKLRRFNWFDHLCRRRSPTVSIFSIIRRGRSKQGSAKIHASKYSQGSEAMKVPPSKSFIRPKTKDAKEKVSKKAADKKKDKPQTAAPPYIDDSPDSEEESVSRVTYSDFTGAKQLSHTVLVNEKDEKPTKAPMSDDNQTRVSFTGSTDSKKISPRFALPTVTDLGSTDAAQHPSILRKDLGTEGNLLKDESSKSDTIAIDPKSVASSSIAPRLSTSPHASARQSTLPEQRGSFELRQEKPSARRPSKSPSINSNTPRSILKSSSLSSNASELPSQLNLKTQLPAAGETLQKHEDLPPTAVSATKLPTEQQDIKSTARVSQPQLPDKPTFLSEPVPSVTQQEPKPTTGTSQSLQPDKSLTHLTSMPTPTVEQPLASAPNINKSKKSVGTSLPSLAYSDDALNEPASVHRIETGTSVPSLPFTEEDNAPIPSVQKTHYFTPTASEGSIFEQFKAENETSEDDGATPKTSKEKIKKPPPSPPKS